jgi:hypothetical protein
MYMCVVVYFLFDSLSPQNVQKSRTDMARCMPASDAAAHRRAAAWLQPFGTHLHFNDEHTAPTLLSFSGFAASASAALAPPRQPPRSHSMLALKVPHPTP